MTGASGTAPLDRQAEGASKPVVLVHDRGAVRHLVLNRPKKRNALTTEMVRLLVDEITAADSDPSCRVVVISGTGPNFCGGVDLTEAESVSGIAGAVTWLQAVRRVFAAIRRSTLPTVVAVEGMALGGGFELAICADFRVGARSARFGLPELDVGAIPSGGGLARLPELVGLGHAKEIVLAGRQLNGPTAEQWGLVTQLVPDGTAADAALELAERVASRPSAVMRLAKLALQAGSETDGNAADVLEFLATVAVFGTEDRIEGMRAFIEKRAPDFTHR